MESSKASSRKSILNYPTLLSLSTTKLNPKLKLNMNMLASPVLLLSSPQNKPNTSKDASRSSLVGAGKGRSNDRLLTMPAPLRPYAFRMLNEFTEAPKFPTSPNEICEFYSNLPDWVKEEINKFPCVYYLSKQPKKEVSDFDDENGDYNITLGDDVEYRYEIIEILGKGTFGRVVKAYDHLEKKNTALKIIKNRQRYYDQAMIEIEILDHFKDITKAQNYIVGIEGSFVFRNHMVYFK